LNHSATILVSNEKRRLDNFKRLVFFFLCLLIAAFSGFFLFEREVLDFFVRHMPMTEGKTPEYYADLLRLGAYELVWTAAILVVALVLYKTPKLVTRFEMFEIQMDKHRGSFIGSLSAIYICTVLLVSYFALERFPNSSDEYVYLYQAQTYLDGKLWDSAHPIDKSFGFNHIAVKDGIIVGRFPPGWPAALALFMLLGIPAFLVNPILSVITLLVFYRFALRKYGGKIAGWATIILAFTGFFIFNSASYFSHILCLLATVMFARMVDDYIETPQLKFGLLAGVSLGIIATSRYYTALLLFLPYFIVLIYQQGWRSLRLFIFMAAGSVPFLIFLLWYNDAVTGNVFQPVTVWGYKSEGIGFVNDHTLLKGFEHVLRRMLMFAFWCSPVLLVLYFFFICRKLRSKSSALIVPEDYFFLTLIIGYFFYYEIGGNQYGPRFYLESLPFLILFLVHTIFREKKSWAKIFLYAAILVATVKLPFIGWRENRIVKERKDVYRLVDEQRVHNAVVLLSSGTSVIRPMPSGDLTRNDIGYTNDVLYAIDHIEANEPLMEYYGGRKFYRYVRAPGEARGKLVRIR